MRQLSLGIPLEQAVVGGEGGGDPRRLRAQSNMREACVAWPSSGLRHTIFLCGAHLNLLLAWNPGLLGLTAEAVPAKGCLSEDG